MLKRSRKELKAIVADQAAKFQRLLGKPIQVRFGVHSIDTRINEVKLARQADMDNVPEMRQDDTGKLYTPSSLQVDCEGGHLFFVIEDIENIYSTLAGIVIQIVDFGDVCFYEDARCEVI